jgi:uncharacterized protein (TIGR04255 family)
MEYSNKHLAEVICGFQFTKESVKWDSTFYGQYYEKIKSFGFTERQERKGVQIQTNPIQGGVYPRTSSQIVEDNVVFRNLSKGWGIAIGKGKISFHVISGYTNWEDFLQKLIIPYMKMYLELGLGNGPRQCNVMYLNRFNKNVSENLSDLFTIISPLHIEFGNEINTVVQRTFNNKGNNLLITKLNSIVNKEGMNAINLECGAICISNECMNTSDWIKQANETHDPVRNFFESIITPKLRQEL